MYSDGDDNGDGTTVNLSLHQHLVNFMTDQVDYDGYQFEIY